MRTNLLPYLVLAAIALFMLPHFSSANILDYFWSENDNSTGRDESTNQKTCECHGSTCLCCVDFNLTYIDLGGPGCVQMKYISQDEGLMVNVSYGESLLHSEQVKGPNPDPTCMSILASLAHVCARFSNLQPFQEGLKGCMNLEPKLLGEVTTSFKIGCFTMGPNGMSLEKTNLTLFQAEASNVTATEADNQNGTQLLGSDLFAVVNESAEQGLAFLGNLLGLAFDTDENDDGTNSTERTSDISTTATSVSRETNGTQLLGSDLFAVVNESAEQGLAFLGNLLGLAFDTDENDDGTNSTERTSDISTTATSVSRET